MAKPNSYANLQAAVRRLEREAQKKHRELQRRTKEQAKLSALEQARLEVETYQNSIDILLSMHKEQAEYWDWIAIKTSLFPPSPRDSRYHELRKQQQGMVTAPAQRKILQEELTIAKRQDEIEYKLAMQNYSSERAEIERMRKLAERILMGEHAAYYEVLKEFNPFKEISEFCSKLRFILHNKTLMVCELKVKGQDAIPQEVKTLTANGKLSVKPMPKARFHEFYQDCICSCMLRVARELFAMLPLETLLLTASADMIDNSTGIADEQAVLSVVMPRAEVSRLNFERIDPSDAVDTFHCRGDFKASRKSGAFVSITKLTPADLLSRTPAHISLAEMVTNARKVRNEMSAISERINSEFALSEEATAEWANE